MRYKRDVSKEQMIKKMTILLTSTSESGGEHQYLVLRWKYS